jgi:hypothetical protein
MAESVCPAAAGTWPNFSAQVINKVKVGYSPSSIMTPLDSM